MKRPNLLWRDRKRNFLGLPWTFTVYMLDTGRLFIDTGFFNTTEDDIRLYRITDITLHRSLWQKIIGTGTIHCDSADQTMKNFDIKNIKKPYEVKEQLSELVEEARRKNRVYARENMYTGDHDAEGFNPDAFDQEAFNIDADFDSDDNDGR